jgi:release factor glutamine methyltransferase
MIPRSVGEALAHARELGIDRLDAQCLVAHVLRQGRAWVLAHDADALDDNDAHDLAALLQRRAGGEPIAYLLGEREFRGLDLEVTPDVLIPRADTETLVDWALELLDGELARVPVPRVIDLGTGSGAIALAIKHGCARAEVHATDLSDAALAVAQRNSRRLGLPINWHRGAWWQAVQAGQRFDLALSNPPYIAPGDPHLPALKHEPAMALVPNADPGDGLADIGRIGADAITHLAPGGWLLLEHGFAQASAVTERLLDSGFKSVQTRMDLSGRPRVTGGVHRP